MGSYEGEVPEILITLKQGFVKKRITNVLNEKEKDVLRRGRYKIIPSTYSTHLVSEK